MPKFYAIVAGVLLHLHLDAQDRVLHGFLQDSITHFAIPYGTVINGTVNKSVTADSTGFFSIQVAPNERLIARVPTYAPDTLTYSMLFSDTITIYLSTLGNVLPGVTVTSRYTKYQLDSMRRKSEFEQNRGTRLPAISSSNSSGFGVGLNLDRVFKRKDRYARTNEKRLPKREEMAYIDYRFSPYIVAHYTGFRGDTLRDFMNKSTPSYKWLREHPSNEDVLYYINDRLKAYKAVAPK